MRLDRKTEDVFETLATYIYGDEHDVTLYDVLLQSLLHHQEQADRIAELEDQLTRMVTIDCGCPCCETFTKIAADAMASTDTRSE